MYTNKILLMYIKMEGKQNLIENNFLNNNGFNPGNMNPTSSQDIHIKKIENNIKYKNICINLRRRFDRKRCMIKLFADNNITNYEFFDAIDGKTLQPTDQFLQLFLNNPFGNRRGVIGCALSHYNVWIKLLEDTNNDYYMIFEDDVILDNDYPKKFNEIINKITPDIDIIYFGFTLEKINLEKNYTLYRQNTTNSIHRLYNDIYAGGFFSYLINKRGAKKLLDYINKNGIKMAIDWVPFHSNMNLYETHPHIVFSPSVQHDSDSVDTDIQRKYDAVNIEPCIKNNVIIDDNKRLFA